MTELDRKPAAVIRAVRRGEVVVLSRHRRAVAMILPLADEERLVPLDARRAAGLAALAAEFRRRADRRWWSAFMHGRAYGRVYRRFRRRRTGR